MKKEFVLPIYKITQKQGNRSITSTLEAKSLSDLQAFLTAVSTAKITCIYELHYEDNLSVPPVDDFQYFKQFKAFGTNKNNITKQILIHNIKLNMNEDKLRNLIKTHLEVGGLKIDGLKCRLFMRE